MKRKLVPSATFINNFGVSNPRYKLLNILKLNGGAMSVGDLMRENTDPHEGTIYMITDFVRDGLLEPELAAGNLLSEEGSDDPALRLRLKPDERICLTHNGKLALENSA